MVRFQLELDSGYKWNFLFIIYTNKGKIGNIKVSFNYSFGFLEAPPREAPMLVLLVKELPRSRSSSLVLSKQLQKLLLGLKRASRSLKSLAKQGLCILLCFESS